MRKILTSAAAFVALSSHQGAIAAEAAKPCLSNTEFRSVIVALLPVLHKQAVTSCTSFLPANAGLLVDSGELTARYETAAARERMAAGDIIVKLMADDLPPQMSGSAIFPFVEGMIPGLLATELNAESCVIANNIWSAMAPLPPENIASTLGAIVLAASQDKKSPADGKAKKTGGRGFDDFAVCPYVATVEPERS